MAASSLFRLAVAAAAVLRRSGGLKVHGGKDADHSQVSCMKEKNIVFIGPSTTFYDYVTLAYYAEHGGWPEGDAGPDPPLWQGSILDAYQAGQLALGSVSSDNLPLHCEYHEWWPHFFAYTNNLLTQKGGSEICDCYRRNDAGDWWTTYYENRLYSSASGDIRMSYFNWWGEEPHKGIWPDSAHMCPVGAMPSEAWRNQYMKTYDIPDFINTIVRPMKPTHLIISAGAWVTPDDDSFWERLAVAGALAVQETGGHVYWKTTSMRKVPAAGISKVLVANARKMQHPAFALSGWKVFPGQAIVSSYQGSRADDDVYADHYCHLQPHAECYLMRAFYASVLCRDEALSLNNATIAALLAGNGSSR